ncbi:MAG: maleylpyruvate isomerase family mycothiol-dependent enzyme [Jatrophihabitans endophyticus]|nr:maleylpyruvate isomerase family mycothiol-dependent enzyme [Jatrophihabitans endophyticus]
MDTVEALSDADFDSGRTLCSRWAPRDVLAHLIGTGEPVAYLRGALRVNAVNAEMVTAARRLSRGELTARGRLWAERPSMSNAVAARFLLGDVAVHHQDVLRGLGRIRDVPPAAAAAILREGVVLSTGTRRNLLRYRVEPVDGPTLGRGRAVRGTSEALGLWLAGRKGLETELEFA